MQAPVRPRRSVLYMLGSNPRALEKGRQLPADALILDLEDAVAPDAKPQGRDAIRDALAAKAAYGRRELVVRVNGLDTPWGHADLAAMAAGGPGATPLRGPGPRGVGAPSCGPRSNPPTPSAAPALSWTPPARPPACRSGA